ncbi:MAG: hypothetical protein ACTTJX_06540 [Fusobacterium sp.]|uniref:hypothetical protein n=1 Tax=Fusobacterium sp. TaxID=68766 RepID=UPI003FA0731C
MYIKFKKEKITENKKQESLLVEELENADLYQVFLLMNLTKIKELSINTKIKKERDFYNKLYEMVLQTRQVELIEKGVF